MASLTSNDNINKLFAVREAENEAEGGVCEYMVTCVLIEGRASTRDVRGSAAILWWKYLAHCNVCMERRLGPVCV